MEKMIENIRKILSSEAGAALIVALGVVMVMMIIGALVVSIAINRDKTVAHDRQLTEAESVAEAGIDEAIQVTLSNFDSVYNGGVIPPASTLGDGVLLFDSKPLTDGNDVRVGSYSVWTKADPNVPGNVLITAQGTDDAQTPFTSTVRVSVKYASNFDYALFTGTPSNLSNTTFTAQGRGGDDDDDCGESDEHDDNGSCGANITVTGKVNVNGNMTINSLSNGDNGNHWDDDHGNHHYDDHNENPGFVTFTPRQGLTDPVNWTSSFTGNKPSGTQPARGNTIVFPTVNFDAFTGSSVTTVNFPSSGAPAGWTRGNKSNTFSISADNFQSRYGSYDVVKFTSSQSNVKMQINGTCTSPSLTSTIMVAGVPGSNTGISELDLIGPGIDLQPKNGIAILSGEGLVSLQKEVEVGKVGNGALIYLSGQNGTSSLQVNGNLIMYGSIIVNGATTFAANGVGRTDHHDHGDEDHHYGSRYCDSKYDEHHSDEGNGNTTNQFLSYDGAYLTNSRLPADWWSWNGGTNFTAVKYNFVRN
ncbi:MAG: pilus assembly PilX N-terminal domain-containing protein [Actinobacteria bacterium]|nr:pilus assembly PilX N-terminal domain-containing protein [Actinomycetota bacterium]MCL5883095.1 pilus assembly PilX N-terminal domain-containing protein [Actinomycetota bacterium]